MVDRKETKQAQRTRKVILNSFLKLLSTMGYKDITIIDICDDALISRGTYYSYFEDKQDLLDYCTHEIIFSFDNEVMKVLPNKEYHAYYNELFEVIIKYVDSNKTRLNAIFSNLENGAVMSVVENYFENNFRHRIRDLRAKGFDINVPEDLVVTFFAGGCMNMLKVLVSHEEPTYDITRLAQDFNTLIVDTLDRIVYKVN